MKTIILRLNIVMQEAEKEALEITLSSKMKANVVILDAKFSNDVVIL